MSNQETSAVPSTNEALPPPASTDFDARREYGKEARRRTPRSVHEGWTPPADRADPVALLEEQATTRVPELVPIRHARMMVSPFTFYRGAALLMAADLAGTPVSGITTQICGDAHLSNFGVFGTPERRLVFDMNDFDETLPGPWEWDVKRLAASFEVAGRSRGFTDEERREINLTVVRGYRERMLQAADSRVLDAWYDELDTDRFMAFLEEERKRKQLGGKQLKRADAALAKARTKDSMRAVAKLTEVVDGTPADHRRPAADRADRAARPEWADAGAGGGLDARGAGVVPDDPPAAEPSDAGVLVRAPGAQGRGRRQRRHARVDRAAARP